MSKLASTSVASDRLIQEVRVEPGVLVAGRNKEPPAFSKTKHRHDFWTTLD